MAELRKCESDLHAYADERGLSVRLDPAYPGAPAPEDQPGPVKHSVWSLIGVMPGGTVGRLRHQATFGRMMGMNAQGHHTVFIARQAETVGYVPLLNCRCDGFGSELFAWAGDKRPRQKQTFESLELDRRFVIEVAKGQDQVWLYRLFSPSLVDWLAQETPPDFGFRLSSGSFDCEVPQWRGQHRADGQVDFEHLDLVASCGGRVAGRIRDEVLEQVGLGRAPAPGSAAANREWSQGKRHGRIIGTLLKLTGSDKDDSAARFAVEHGFPEPVDPATFHAARTMLPLPGAATDVFSRSASGGSRGVELAWLEYESDYYGLRYYVAAVADLGVEIPDVWFDEDEVLALDADSENRLPPDAMRSARRLRLGISTGGGAAAIYVSSTGWDGRPSGSRINEMLEASEGIFASLEHRGSGPGAT